MAFTPEELVGISVWAQRHYYKKYEVGDYLINAIFNLAKVNERKDGTIRVTEPAKRELAALIELHPEQFAKDVVVPSSYVAPNGKKYHEENCQNLKNQKRKLTIEEAEKEGYEPGKCCH